MAVAVGKILRMTTSTFRTTATTATTATTVTTAPTGTATATAASVVATTSHAATVVFEKTLLRKRRRMGTSAFKAPNQGVASGGTGSHTVSSHKLNSQNNQKK